jgi:hypothetical protein
VWIKGRFLLQTGDSRVYMAQKIQAYSASQSISSLEFDDNAKIDLLQFF